MVVGYCRFGCVAALTAASDAEALDLDEHDFKGIQADPIVSSIQQRIRPETRMKCCPFTLSW